MNIVSAGSRFMVYGEDVQTYKILPPGAYKVEFSKMMGFSLSVHNDLLVKEKMYEYSEIEFEEYKTQGNLYIYNIKLSERDAPAHPVKNMQIIMKLKEGINFELSFNME